jgi:hypothetical protein
VVTGIRLSYVSLTPAITNQNSWILDFEFHFPISNSTHLFSHPISVELVWIGRIAATIEKLFINALDRAVAHAIPSGFPSGTKTAIPAPVIPDAPLGIWCHRAKSSNCCSSVHIRLGASGDRPIANAHSRRSPCILRAPSRNS